MVRHGGYLPCSSARMNAALLPIEVTRTMAAPRVAISGHLGAAGTCDPLRAALAV